MTTRLTDDGGASGQGPGLRTLGVRGRTTVALATAALVVSVTLAFSTYQLARGFFVDQRLDVAEGQTMVAATIFNGVVSSGTSVSDALLSEIRTDSPVVVRSDGKWYSNVPLYGSQAVPDQLRTALADDGASFMVTTANSSPHAVFAIPLDSIDAEYYQFFDLAGTEENLSTLRNVLIIAVLAITTVAALTGAAVAKRVLQPLGVTATAAQLIASGELETRLDAERDPDLTPLVDAFNHMAASLEERIDRERRFATDVSHELRTPLAAMTSAVALMRRRRGELSETGQAALDELDKRTQQFSQLALDVLHLSRLETNLVPLEPEYVGAVSLLVAVLDEVGASGSLVEEADDVGDETVIRTDERRLRIILRNLIENADRYAGGVTRVGVGREEEMLVIDVDDEGPGIRTAERGAIFERFHRGDASNDRPDLHGNGLGLALVAENVRALDGTVEVLDSPGGGARFRLRLPVGGPAESPGTGLR